MQVKKTIFTPVPSIHHRISLKFMRRVNPVSKVLTFLLKNSLKKTCGGFVNTIPHQKVLFLTVEFGFEKIKCCLDKETGAVFHPLLESVGGD